MKTLILILSLAFLSPAFSQFTNIKDSDILYKQRIVRSLNLNNSTNQDLFGQENILAQLLLEAYEKGDLVGFRGDELKEILPYDDYRRKMVLDLGEGDSLFYSARHLYQIEIGEDLIFDRHRSEIIFDMESLTLFIPQNLNQRNLLEPVVSFKYDDCLQIFKKDERAYAINPLMNGRNLNYSEVFLLRLFVSDIVKIGNDNYFDQMYADPTRAYLARKEAENKLTEYLYKLYNPK